MHQPIADTCPKKQILMIVLMHYLLAQSNTIYGATHKDYIRAESFIYKDNNETEK
tara:strand:- start:78 stop:242 length:165 start_codon:yes stop_codon:yes gene_type:complete